MNTPQRNTACGHHPLRDEKQQYDSAVSIDVGVRALRGRFDLFRQASDKGKDPAAFLLRFYAVECGLKAAILTRRKARSTAQLPLHLRSHDLQALTTELKLPPAATRGLTYCKTHGAEERRVAVHEVHEAWRYGARLSASTEDKFVAGLDLLIDWCRKELR